MNYQTNQKDEVVVDIYIPADSSASSIAKRQGVIHVPENERVSNYVRRAKELEIHLPGGELYVNGSFVLVPHDEKRHEQITTDNSAVYEKKHMKEKNIILSSLFNNLKISGTIRSLGGKNPTKQGIWTISNAEIYVVYFDGEDRLKAPVAIIRPWENYILGN